MRDDQVLNDDDRPCSVCGVLSGGVLRDPATGEEIPIWWCVNCGTNRSAPGSSPAAVGRGRRSSSPGRQEPA